MQAACSYVLLVTQSSELCEVVLVIPCIGVSYYVYFNFSAIYAWPLPEATFDLLSMICTKQGVV